MKYSALVRMWLGLFTFVALLSLLLSDLLYFNSGYGPVSLFLLLVAPLCVAWVLTTRAIAVNSLTAAIYLFLTILAGYTLVGVLAFSRPTLAVQFLSSFAAAFLLLNIGYFAERSSIARWLSVVVWVSFLFAIFQFLYFTHGQVGPLSMYENISELAMKSQADISLQAIYGRPTGVFSNPNTLGFFGGIGFWVLIYLRPDISRPNFLIGASCALACVLISMSRGSLLGMLASLLIYFLRSRKRFNSRAALTWLASVVILFVSANVYFDSLDPEQKNRFFELATVLGGDLGSSENLSGRVRAWEIIVDSSARFPFGTIVPPQLLLNESPDNQFVYYFAQGGFFLLIFSAIFYLFLLVVSRRYGSSDRAVLPAAIVFVIVNSMTMVVANSFTFALFWLLMGLCSRDRVRIKM